MRLPELAISIAIILVLIGGGVASVSPLRRAIAAYEPTAKAIDSAPPEVKAGYRPPVKRGNAQRDGNGCPWCYAYKPYYGWPFGLVDTDPMPVYPTY